MCDGAQLSAVSGCCVLTLRCQHKPETLAATFPLQTLRFLPPRCIPPAGPVSVSHSPLLLLQPLSPYEIYTSHMAYLASSVLSFLFPSLSSSSHFQQKQPVETCPTSTSRTPLLSSPLLPHLINQAQPISTLLSTHPHPSPSASDIHAESVWSA